MTTTTAINPDDKRASERADQGQEYIAEGVTTTGNNAVDFGDNVGNTFNTISTKSQPYVALLARDDGSGVTVTLQSASGDSPANAEFQDVSDQQGNTVTDSVTGGNAVASGSVGPYTVVGKAYVEEGNVRVTADDTDHDVVVVTRGAAIDEIDGRVTLAANRNTSIGDVGAGHLEAEDSTTNTSSTVLGGWSDPQGAGSVSTVTLGSDTYLDLRHISFLRIRGRPDTSTDVQVTVDRRLTSSDDDSQMAQVTLTNNSANFVDIVEQSVEAIHYCKVTVDDQSTIAVAGVA